MCVCVYSSWGLVWHLNVPRYFFCLRVTVCQKVQINEVLPSCRWCPVTRCVSQLLFILFSYTHAICLLRAVEGGLLFPFFFFPPNHRMYCDLANYWGICFSLLITVSNHNEKESDRKEQDADTHSDAIHVIRRWGGHNNKCRTVAIKTG